MKYVLPRYVQLCYLNNRIYINRIFVIHKIVKRDCMSLDVYMERSVKDIRLVGAHSVPRWPLRRRLCGASSRQVTLSDVAGHVGPP